MNTNDPPAVSSVRPSLPEASPATFPAAAAKTEHSATNIPKIIQKLGESLKNNQERNPYFLERVLGQTKFSSHSFKESNRVLEEIFRKTKTLMKSEQNPDEFISLKIKQLEKKVKDLEASLNPMELAPDELRNLKEITTDFQKTLSSMEDWLSFRESFFSVDDQLFNSLARMEPSLYSDLHGWTLTAFQSVSESLRQMVALIKLTGPALNRRDAFFSDILKQLAVSIHAATWDCQTWFHEISAHCDELLSTSERQWKKANEEFEQQPSLEAYTQMHLAAQQLQSMRQILVTMEKEISHFVDLKTVAKKLEQNLEGNQLGLEEYGFKKESLQDLGSFQETLNDAKNEIPEQLRKINQIFLENDIEATLSKAKQSVKEHDFKAAAKAIINDYKAGKDFSIKGYVAVKQQLSGILSIPGSYPEVHAFCKSQEKRLVEKNNGFIDFNSLILAKWIDQGKLPPGIFSRIFSVLDPSNWSDRIKQCVNVGFTALQLADQVSKMGPKVETKLQHAESALTPEQQKIVDKEAAWLGGILNSKFQFLKDSNTFDKLTSRSEAIRPVLQVIVDRYGSLNAELCDRLIDGYRAYRQGILLTGSGNLKWIENFAPAPPTQTTSVKPPVNLPDNANIMAKTKKTALPNIKGTAPFLSISQATAKQEVFEGLKEAAQKATSLDQQLRECSRIEFLALKPLTTPQALDPLRNEVALMRRSLLETMANKPSEQTLAPVWVEWSQSVQKQCYDLNDLEARIESAMEVYQEALAMSGAHDGYAHLDVYGNKHKNLVRQFQVAEAVGVEGLAVPMPRGIAEGQVLKFLRIHAPEIFTHWDQIGALYITSPKGILENKEALSHLKAIDEGIERAFSKASEDETTFKDLGIDKKFNEWLDVLAKENKFLMVRSTGAEDSKQSANAGGNASLSYVKPTQEEICKAFGEVIRSYFGVESLQKRINANLNPFEDELRVAVTTQELIGEEVGGTKDPSKVPISLVLFSNEPLFIGDEEFRVMRISATYGHGEGVVGNQGISSDTVLILVSVSNPDQLYVLYDNQEKPERLAPIIDKSTGKVSLQKVPNSPDMAKKPVLNNELIARLYEWGIIGEKYYEGDPTDMEIVIEGHKDGKKTIRPVQARPINRPKFTEPTYFDFNKAPTAAIEKTIKTEMIVPGKASVIEITDPNEILIADTLKKADQGLFKKGQHKLIVVGQKEPANSHPVVNFSALGIPCLFGKDLNEIQRLIKEINSSRHLAACVQSAKLSLWDTSKGDIKDYTTNGFVVHPAQIAISLPLNRPVPIRAGIHPEAPEQILQMLSELGSAMNEQQALIFLNALKNDPWITSLQTTLNDLLEKVTEQPLFEKEIRPIIQAAETLNQKIQESFSQIESLLQQPKGRLNLLIHVKTLETLLFQMPTSSGAIAQYSHLSLQQSFAAANDIMAYQSQLNHPAYFADILLDGTQCPMGEAFEQWNTFLLNLESVAEETLHGKETGLSTAEISEFKKTLSTMRQAEVLPLFLTFFFSRMDQKNPIETLKAIITLMPKQEQPIIDQIFTRKKEINQLRNEIGQIGNPKTYPELFSRLQKEAQAFSANSQAWMKKEEWDKMSPMTRSIAIGTINELVDLYDIAIKTMKASSEITSDVEKTQKFKQMLGPYLELFKCLAKEVVGETGYVTHPDWPLDAYLKTVEGIFQKLPDSDVSQLLTTPGFDVDGAILNSGARFYQGFFPERLEDIFTWTHQNLIVTTSVLTKILLEKDQIKQSFLPDSLKAAFEDGLVKISDDSYDPVSRSGERHLVDGRMGNVQLVGVDVSPNKIAFNYNLPMRDHSAKYSVSYDRQTKKTSMESRFMGVNMAYRWDRIAQRADILSFLNILPLDSKPKIEEWGLILSWDVSEKTHLNHALKEFHFDSWLSFDTNRRAPDIPIFSEELIKKEKIIAAARYAINENMESEVKKGFIKAIINNFSKEFIDSNGGVDQAIFLAQTGFQAGYNHQARWREGNTDLRNLSINLWEKLFTINKGTSEAIAIIQKDCKDSESKVRHSVLQLTKKLIEKNEGISEAIGVAQLGLKDSDLSVRKASIEVWIDLFDANKGIQEAKAIIQEATRDSDLRLPALEFAKKFIVKNEGIAEAITIVQVGFGDKNPAVRKASMELLIHLIDKGTDIQDVITLVLKAITDSNLEMTDSTFELARKLIQKDQHISEVLTLAQIGLKDNNPSVRKESIKLLCDLLNAGKDIQEAMTSTLGLIDDSDWKVRFTVLELVEKLIEKDQNISESIAIAQKIYIDHRFNKDTSMHLWEKLFAMNKGIPEAIIVIKKEMEVEDDDLRLSTVELARKLIDKDQCVPEAIMISQAGFKSYGNDIRNSSIRLWEQLFTMGKGIPEAISAAQEAFNSDFFPIRKSAIELIETLVAKNHGIEEALVIAKAGIQDRDSYIRKASESLLAKLVPNSID